MLDNENKPLETVPEVWLRKRKQADKQNIHNKRQQKIDLRKQKKSLRTEFIRADYLVKKRKEMQHEVQRLRNVKRRVAKQGDLPESQQGQLLLVIRSDGIQNKRQKTGEVKSTLKELRLGKIHSAVFLRSSPAVHLKLQKVRPYVFTGTPSLETVRNLINKRAHTLVKNKRVPVSDNNMVEEALGDIGVICVEDIIHEIMNGDKDTFEKVATYLEPFELNMDSRNNFKRTASKLAEKAQGDNKRVHKNVDAFVEYYN
ncbi:ribosomal protein L30, ferredoxin-like fold domain-containing protein [Halteromyces radiatus]|uniref:ribosomal protein L30, ferredoxin-like fold domain-containing protein n=1 Tax=Halteromyces radiatus TaxID=101107 RepID=UPI00221ECD2B|nr:ribosomal protein L30, ferredoxin-like fold domain-containing protein [Halteromyces radiatus]KAI8084648.1 ribosomal protein L30, ferredoxin-like fold domain-containing protein [Halteromyces radiatus]